MPPLAEELRQFVIGWHWRDGLPGAVLCQVMRVPRPSPRPNRYDLSGRSADAHDGGTPSVFDALAERGAMAAPELARCAVSASVVKTLAAGGHLTAHNVPGDKHFPHPDAAYHRVDLSAHKKPLPIVGGQRRK